MTKLLMCASAPCKPGAGEECKLLEDLSQRCQEGVYVLWHLVRESPLLHMAVKPQAPSRAAQHHH